MNRSTAAWLSVVSCAVILAAWSAGCGGGSPAPGGKAGSGGHGGSTAGASGQAGGTAGAAGSTAGAGGGEAGAAGGTAGAAGSAAGSDGGAAGSTAGAGGGAAGSTAGSDGGTDVAMDTKADAEGDSKADTAEVAPTPCVSGGTCSDQNFTCSISRTCRRNQEQFCFCAPNNKIACEPCDTPDAGEDAGNDASTDASTDSGTDAGNALPACPANASNPNTTCDTNGDRCAQSACSNNHRQQVCVCVVFNGNTGRYFCGLSAMCQ
jgi:hypothetical protein